MKNKKAKSDEIPNETGASKKRLVDPNAENPFVESHKKKIMMRGVIPSKNIVGCVAHKSAKKGTKSFRITSALLNNLVKKAQRIGKTPLLNITIPTNEKENFILTCYVTKEKN